MMESKKDIRLNFNQGIDQNRLENMFGYFSVVGGIDTVCRFNQTKRIIKIPGSGYNLLSDKLSVKGELGYRGGIWIPYSFNVVDYFPGANKVTLYSALDFDPDIKNDDYHILSEVRKLTKNYFKRKTSFIFPPIST
jgi:hypothetical protein